jgi:hypothetical protein
VHGLIKSGRWTALVFSHRDHPLMKL